MPPRPTMALEIGREHVRAVSVARNGDTVKVRNVLVAEIPAELRSAAPERLGKWLGDQLVASGVGRGRSMIALAREHVGLKRLSLPTIDDDELPQMTRLALQRELPFDAEEAAIDYLVVERDDARSTVLAVAAPAELIEKTKATAAAAKVPIDRVTLRVLGSATIVGALEPDPPCALVVDVTGEGIEFSIIENGLIRFSRSAPLSLEHGDDSPEARAAAIVTETRRTWMSYRIVETASDVARVLVLGPPSVAEAAAPAIGEALGVDATALREHPAISGGDRVGLDRVWPLAGLLLRAPDRDARIDFADPRRPADHAAKPRRWAIMAAGLVALALLATWTVSGRQKRDLRTELTALSKQVTGLRGQVARYQRDAFSLIHLQEWESVEVPWLDHVLAVQELTPPAPDVVLDGWIGDLEFRGVRYDRKERVWQRPASLTIVVDGEAKDRETADSLREALVELDLYETISSGSDAPGGRRLPFGFTYRLTAQELASPRKPTDDSAAANETPSPGGGGA